MRFVASRFGQAIVVVWLTYTATFFLLSALPGDGIMIKFENPDMGLSAEQIAQIREYMRVDDPLLLQYLHAIIGTLQGDFGYSIVNALPVSDRLAAALPETLQLAGGAFLVAVLIAVLVTAASVFAPFAWIRNAVQAVPSLCISIPSFWLGLVLIQVVSFQLGWIPMIGATDSQALVLPVLTLAIPVSAPLAQVFCRSLDAANARPFVTVVQAKGATPWWIITRHTAKNALLPVLTISGLIVGELIAGSVVVETVFGRNGIGRLVNESVAAQDLPVIQAVVVLSAVVFVLVNLLVDFLFPVLDPRLRSARSETTHTVKTTTDSPEDGPVSLTSARTPRPENSLTKPKQKRTRSTRTGVGS